MSKNYKGGESILAGDDSTETDATWAAPYDGSEDDSTTTETKAETVTHIATPPSEYTDAINDVTTFGEIDDEFCVGWLLCISGPLVGRSFILKNGRNSVGRSISNRIALGEVDPSISGKAQIYVVYDPEENAYAIAPGEGSAITRLNGKRLDVPGELKWGDFITLSKKTSLRFIPACDARFRWITEES